MLRRGRPSVFLARSPLSSSLTTTGFFLQGEKTQIDRLYSTIVPAGKLAGSSFSNRKAVPLLSCRLFECTSQLGHIQKREFVRKKVKNTKEQEKKTEEGKQEEAKKEEIKKEDVPKSTDWSAEDDGIVLIFQNIKSWLSMPLMLGFGAIALTAQIGSSLTEVLPLFQAGAATAAIATMFMVGVGQVAHKANRRVVGVMYKPNTKEVVLLRPKFLLPSLAREVVPLRNFSVKNPSLWQHYIEKRNLEKKCREEDIKKGRKLTVGWVGVGFNTLIRGPEDKVKATRLSILGFSTELVDVGVVDVWSLDAVLRGQEPTPPSREVKAILASYAKLLEEPSASSPSTEPKTVK